MSRRDRDAFGRALRVTRHPKRHQLRLVKSGLSPHGWRFDAVAATKIAGRWLASQKFYRGPHRVVRFQAEQVEAALERLEDLKAHAEAKRRRLRLEGSR